MDPEISEHLNAIRRWLDEVEAIPLPEPQPAGLSGQEKQELRRVEGLIAQLKVLGVTSIPPELVEKRSDLSARDVPESPLSDAARFLPLLDELRESLNKLSRKARDLREQIRTRAARSGPRAYYPVEVLDLLQTGLLSTEDHLELQWSRDSGVFEGRLERDGRIRAKTQDGWMAFDSLSSAAQFISGRPQNGWDHWRRVNEDGTRTQLKRIRERYQKEVGNA